MAAVAVGMFIGCWIVGPTLTRDSGAIARPSAKAEPMSYEAMLAQPDPFPYRTATPQFEDSGPTHYAEAAREKARASIGRRAAADPWSTLPGNEPYEQRRPTRRMYQVPDRHAVY
jgi:hypothetical protein